MYLIRGLEPNPECMAAHSFCIELSPEWREMAAASGIDQESVNRKVGRMEASWKKAVGINCKTSREIRVDWGDWGIRHVTVPGNACGLDIEERAFGTFIDNAAMLVPHNVDSWMQKKLILLAFCSIAEDIVLLSRTEVA